jgi:hypothetical protein
MQSHLSICCAIATLCTAGLTSAGPALSDPGFESPIAGQNLGYHYFNPNASSPGQSPWTFIGSAGLARPGWQSLAFVVPEGQQVGFLQGGDGGLAGGSFSSGISQTITGLTPSASYRVEFRAGLPDNNRSIEPTRVHVLVDGLELASVLPGSALDFYQSTTFTAPASGSASLTFIGQDPNPTFDQALTFVDAVNVASVPEPQGILGCLACGALGFASRLGRRNRRGGAC